MEPENKSPESQPPQISTEPTYPQPVTVAPDSQPAAPVSEALPPSISRMKSLFLKVLIGCLIASATVAVTAILAGGLGEIGGKALGTIVVVGLHALFALGFIGMDSVQDEQGGVKVFANVMFGIIVASFITATLGIWEVIPGELLWKLYATYVILAVAVLHGEVLARTLNHQPMINYVVYANYVVMTLVVLLLLTLVFIPEVVDAMGGMFYRPLAALAVIDGTLTLTAIILDRLYLSKHPELITSNSVVTGTKRRGLHPIVVVLIILMSLQLVPMLLFAVFGLLLR